ncbi:hypothetical protein BDD43_4330 [Mucilaginibacter gracilis]|uniref:Uncharacterized protein n=1 Tax=Mucilaginibacter gracilis TaxID=423350 RepID=A0A495J5S2_9SPHI|nr:hypothetical protein [Mucilaginibacter gracilis]RKR84103.1 hypothetical protein BDD43_4330 [Mucilaginibacter gracilis]
MKTAEKNAKQVQGTNAKNNNAPRTENRPNLTGKEAKQDEPAKDEKPAEAAKIEATQAGETKAGDTVAVDNQPANAAPEQQEQPIAGEVQKAEIKYIKPALNLEQTLKSVGNLHRLTIQRLALIGRIKTLEDFEVKLVEENDELESNPYQGCKLIIKDDKGREFITNTPNLIRMVTQFIFDACHEKLGEIEANIVFPQHG